MVPQLWFMFLYVICELLLLSYRLPHLHHNHHHYTSRQLENRGAQKFLQPCLSLASLWMVPQLWFIFFIFASTVLRLDEFGRPCFRFPSGVQWIATLVMELASLRSICPIQCHRFLVMMVSISSCWHQVTVGDGSWPKDASGFSETCRVRRRQLAKVVLGYQCVKTYWLISAD